MNKLILFFLKKNFSIIRIGKTANEKLSIKDKNIIDLPFNKLRTDFLEVFLIAKANFFIGTSSGAFKIARIFRKPIFLINVCPLESMFVEYWDYPIIFKKLIYSKTKKYLKISEIIKKGVPFTFRNDLLKEKNLKYVSNSDEEIYQFGKEILSYLDNKSYFSGDKRYLKKISLFRAEITKDPRIKKMNFRNNLGKSFLYSLNI